MQEQMTSATATEPHHATGSTATLSNVEDMTTFSFADQHIRFRSSPKLERYTSVKEWDNGYIVVTAKYRGVGEVEEYVDLLPILKNLHIDSENFLRHIKKVVIGYAE